MARSHPVDVHVGARMRQRRTLLGMSQEKLGTAVGLTFQQIQKYERGSNRISASKLYDAARLLEAPVSYFFEGLDETGEDFDRCDSVVWGMTALARSAGGAAGAAAGGGAMLTFDAFAKGAA